MGFVPFGPAIDKTHGFIYVSNGIGKSIAVYNTPGTLLDTIKKLNKADKQRSSTEPLDLSGLAGTIARGRQKSWRPT